MKITSNSLANRNYSPFNSRFNSVICYSYEFSFYQTILWSWRYLGVQLFVLLLNTPQIWLLSLNICVVIEMNVLWNFLQRIYNKMRFLGSLKLNNLLFEFWKSKHINFGNEKNGITFFMSHWKAFKEPNEEIFPQKSPIEFNSKNIKIMQRLHFKSFKACLFQTSIVLFVCICFPSAYSSSFHPFTLLFYSFCGSVKYLKIFENLTQNKASGFFFILIFFLVFR